MKTALLFLEATVVLIAARILVFATPFRWTRKFFGDLQAPTPAGAPAPMQAQRARAVARRLRGVAARLPWHSTCLVMALSGRMLLARRGMKGAIVRFGVKTDADGKVAAHAWLTYGPETLLGGEEAADFHPLADLF